MDKTESAAKLKHDTSEISEQVVVGLRGTGQNVNECDEVSEPIDVAQIESLISSLSVSPSLGSGSKRRTKKRTRDEFEASDSEMHSYSEAAPRQSRSHQQNQRRRPQNQRRRRMIRAAEESPDVETQQNKRTSSPLAKSESEQVS